MSLSDIKAMKSERGFTIVELLIVIVIIGILAAIVIVAYTGITQRANANAAKSNAQGIQKVAEAYMADTAGGNGSYPSTLVALTGYSGVTKIPSGVTVNSAQLTSSHADGKTIQFIPDNTPTSGTGGCIAYWDSSLSTPAAVYLYVGGATAGSNVATPTCS